MEPLKKSGTSDSDIDIKSTDPAGKRLPQSSHQKSNPTKTFQDSAGLGLISGDIEQLPCSPKPFFLMEVRQLIRKKDVVCLILSYPPFNSRNNETHIGWIRDVLRINHRVRSLKEFNFSELSSEITGLLHHSIHDLEAHVPSDIMVEMCEWRPSRHTTPTDAMLDLCMDDFMIRQFLQNIQIPEIRRILISEVTEKTFLWRLKKLPPIRQMFDIVIHIDVNLCLAIEDVEDRIAEVLGFSKTGRGEADEFLRRLNFLILLVHFHPWTNLTDLGNCWWNSYKTQKIVLINGKSLVSMDLEIKRENHLLSWNLFCRNVGKVVHSSSIHSLAVHLLRQCSGHLLATVLIARALKEVEDVTIWQHASRVIGFLPTSTSHSTEDRILLNALAFILGRGHLGSANQCVKYCASYLEMEGTHKADLLERWMKEDLIGTLDEGERIVQQLIDAVLLESLQNGESIRMPDEVHKGLVNFYKAEMNIAVLLVELDGRGLMEAPKSEAWEEASKMYLMNNKISKLPDNPNCPLLTALFLQGNHHLRVISPSFFQFMPILQILNLSHTKIKSLPQSLFKIVQLRKFILRSCELFKELPVEMGELCHLEVLDLEETEIINLPSTIGSLTKLTSLKVSFYLPANANRKNNPSNRIIPQNVISRLSQLEELSIDVNPEDVRWEAAIKDILKEVCCLNQLHFLKLQLPEVFMLNDLRINLSRMHFRFNVGNHLKRIISRLPHESTIKFEEQESCLKYVNGVGIPTEIKEVLQHATAFFLDHHLTATSLSEFGVRAMKDLKFCVLQECNKIEAIVNADDAAYGDVILQSLEYLSVHYMKNLRSIWKGQFLRRSSLFFLKVLTLYSCPQLTTIFTFYLVQNLVNLEELVVEDCLEINSLLPSLDKPSWESWCLPKLKKMSLHYMPKLVSIFGGEWKPLRLEWLCVYDCPSLKSLYPTEVSSSTLKVITGEAEWWSALKWNASKWFEPQNLDDLFIPLERDIDLRTQLAVINDPLQAQMQKQSPSNSQVLVTPLANPIVEAGTSSKQKQVA